MPAGSGVFTADQENAGATPDYIDIVTNLEAALYPGSSWMPTDTAPAQPESIFYLNAPENVNHQGSPEGRDLTAYGLSKPTEYKARVGFFEDGWKVSDQAMYWTVKGRGKMAEVAYQKMKSLERLKKKQHLRIMSGIDATAEGVSGALFNGTAGICAYARTDGSGFHPIPEAFRPVAAQVVTGASLASGWDEDIYLGMRRAVWDVRKQPINWTNFCGSKFKEQYRYWSIYQKDAGGRTAVRAINHSSPDDGAIIFGQVKYLADDYGEVDVVLEPWLWYTEGTDNTPSAAQNQTTRSGVFLDRNCVKLAYVAAPHHKDGVDGGGGQRGFWKSGLELRNLLPNAHAWATFTGN